MLHLEHRHWQPFAKHKLESRDALVHIGRIGSHIGQQCVESEHLLLISRLKLRIQCRRHIGPHHFHTAVIKPRASVGKQLHSVLIHNLIDRDVPPYTGVVRQQVEHLLARQLIAQVAKAVFKRPSAGKYQLLSGVELHFGGMELQAAVGY